MPDLPDEPTAARPTDAHALTWVRDLVAAEPVSVSGLGGTADGLQRLCRAAVRALPATGAGVSVISAEGARGVAASSSPHSEELEELQFTLGEGPCMDAFDSRRPVMEADLGEGNRWPAYAPAVLELGIGAVFAFPLQVGAARLGVLDLYRERPGSLSATAVAQALAFAEVAMTWLLDGQERASAGRSDDGLDDALEYRSELYQAQGMVKVQLGVDLEEAMARLRAYAYAHGHRLGDVARDVVARRVVLASDT